MPRKRSRPPERKVRHHKVRGEVRVRAEHEGHGHVVEAVRRERVVGAEQVVEVVGPVDVADVADDENPKVRLDPVALLQRQVGLGATDPFRTKLVCDPRQQEYGECHAQPNRHVVPFLEGLVRLRDYNGTEPRNPDQRVE